MAKPLVSVLIPVYNVEKYLERCLDSILKQTLTKIEIICVNDGSTDNSLSILKEYQKKDSRIIIVNKENGGLPSARNAGLDRAEGKYVGFVDSDDYIEPNMFQKLYETAESEKSEVVICGANIFPENPKASGWLYDCLSPQYKKIEGNKADTLFFDVSATPFLWRTLIKRELIEKNHLRLREDIMLGEDKAFQCKVYPLADSITMIPDKLYNYFWYREGSLMNKTVYGDAEKKVMEHGKLIVHIAQTVEKYAENKKLRQDFLEWGIPFLYDDFIYISLKNKIKLAPQVLDAWEKCGYLEYKYELPDWKREMVDYFEQVSKEKEIEPKVSVIVPVDIEAEYLEDMLRSLLDQTLKASEIILVNNGTKDQNYSILHRYLFADKRIRLLNIAHTSYADALNKGINLASSKYMTFAETYDWYHENNGLAEWIKYAEENESDVCASVFCIKDMPGVLSGEYRNVSAVNGIEKYIESDFHDAIYNTEYIKKNQFTFKNSSILTGMEFLVKACLNTEKLSWFDKSVYIQRKMHRADWISTDKCKRILEVMEELMQLAIDKKCAYLQLKIIEMINGDSLGKILLNNTRAFQGDRNAFPNGENSQAEVVISLMRIAALVDPDTIELNGYHVNETFIKTLYEVISERQKFLANLTN